LTDTTLASPLGELDAAHGDVVPQITENPLMVEVPHVTLVPQMTDEPDTFVPQITDVPQVTEVPQVTDDAPVEFKFNFTVRETGS